MSSSSQTAAPAFGKWRTMLWPIHSFELKKVLPLLGMFFCILFNYQILRDTKDSLIVPNCSADAIPFLKVYGVTPMALLFVLLYSKLSNRFSTESLFYGIISGFLLFFGLFGFVFFPNRELLQPDSSANWLLANTSVGFHSLIEAYRNWMLSLFYILSELWGSAALSLLLWGFVNKICRIHEAKRFYSVIATGGNVALLVAGPIIMDISMVPAGINPSVHWVNSIYYLMSLVVGVGALCLVLYAYVQKAVLTDPRFYDAAEPAKAKKEKAKMSLGQSFLFLAKSAYMRNLAIMVVAYGICINIVEVTWKGQLSAHYSEQATIAVSKPEFLTEAQALAVVKMTKEDVKNKYQGEEFTQAMGYKESFLAYKQAEYNKFMGAFTTITGIVTIVLMLFGGSNIIRIFGWTKAALLTPIMLGATGLLFFAFMIFRDTLSAPIAAMGTSVIWMSVLMGMIQNVASKSTKYSLFDPTKEMAYIPCTEDEKVKGKAAVDVVGARMGKSGGSLIQQPIILIFGSVASGLGATILAVVLGLIVLAWIFAASSLGKMFEAATARQEAERANKEAQLATAGAATKEKVSG